MERATSGCQTDASQFLYSSVPQGPKTVQANTDPLPLPRGENLEASGFRSTRYSISPCTSRSTIVRALISFTRHRRPSLGRTQPWYAQMKPFLAQWSGSNTCGSSPLRLTWQAWLLVVEIVSWKSVARCVRLERSSRGVPGHCSLPFYQTHGDTWEATLVNNFQELQPWKCGGRCPDNPVRVVLVVDYTLPSICTHLPPTRFLRLAIRATGCSGSRIVGEHCS